MMPSSPDPAAGAPPASLGQFLGGGGNTSGLPGAGTDAEAQGKMPGQTDHGRGEHLMGAPALLKVTERFETEGEVVAELVAQAKGITKTRLASIPGDEGDEVEHRAGLGGDIALENEPVVEAAFASADDAALAAATGPACSTDGPAVVLAVWERGPGRRSRAAIRSPTATTAAASMAVQG